MAILDPAATTMDLLRTYGPEAQAPAPTVDEAIAYVRGLATTHYENFSVLSSLVPENLRDDFAAVYAFCRWADDLADETGDTEEARERSTRLLGWWREELERCFAAAREDGAGGDGTGGSRHPVFVALHRTVLRHGVPMQPFADLIDAFQQDQRVTRYRTWEQVIDYCRRSANPVGRLVLHLGGYPDTPENAARYRMSDAICTALQLTNFWQDVRRDLLERDRVYMPSEETGVTAEMLRDWASRPEDPAARMPFIKALRPLVERTWGLFAEGRPLPGTLAPHIRPVVWLFGAGGEAVLGAVERGGCVSLWERRTLGRMQKAALLGRAWLRFRLFGRRAGAPGGGTSASNGAHA